MYFVLITVFHLVGVLHSEDNDYSDIMDDICRYRFHASPLPWNQARKVCGGMNRALAKIDNIDKLESVGNMATGNVSSRVPNADLSELWIGLRADKISESVQHFWENCEELNNSKEADSLWINDRVKSVEGCIAMNVNVKKYTAIDCSEARPYICEAQATVPCYEAVDWDSESIFSHFDVRNNLDYSNCANPCLQESRCIAFQDRRSFCDVLTYQHLSTTGPNINVRYPAYTFGFIDLTSRQIDATAVSAPAPCTNTVTPSSASEPSSTMVVTKDGLDEITFTSYIDHTTITALESSEPSYTTSGQDNRFSATTTSSDPLNLLTPGLVETPSAVDSSIVCPNGGMTPEMISKKIRKIAEDLEDDSGKKISIWHSRKNDENVEENHCARDKTFPRGYELMTSINEMRKEIILSKLKQN